MPFPSSPINGQTYRSANGTVYQYDISDNRWFIINAAVVITGVYTTGETYHTGEVYNTGETYHTGELYTQSQVDNLISVFLSGEYYNTGETYNTGELYTSTYIDANFISGSDYYGLSGDVVYISGDLAYLGNNVYFKSEVYNKNETNYTREGECMKCGLCCYVHDKNYQLVPCKYLIDNKDGTFDCELYGKEERPQVCVLYPQKDNSYKFPNCGYYWVEK